MPIPPPLTQNTPPCTRPIAIFAGTSEGRALCQQLSGQGTAATAFVATEYGRAALPPLPGITVQTGRLDESEMQAALQSFDTIVDATHPFAQEVSRNIRSAAAAIGAVYLRLLRPAAPSAAEDGLITLPSVAAAAEYLQNTDGVALLTTGSKELAAFTKIPDFQNRLYPRILPSAEGLSACLALGFPASHILCMQGPFTGEMNAATLRQINARWLVTKESGEAGGLPAKIAAAKAAGATVLLVARPYLEEGLSLQQVAQLLCGGPPGPPPQPGSPGGNPADCQKMTLQNTLPHPAAAKAAPGRRFPLFISLIGQPCLVVGGGAIATRRIQALQNFGALVRVVAPSYPATAPGVHYLKRPYQPGDTQGMRLVVAATNSREVNRAVGLACKEAGIPVSVADSPEESSFFFPALCQSKNLTAGVVSTGKKHHLTAQAAAAIRLILEEIDP